MRYARRRPWLRQLLLKTLLEQRPLEHLAPTLVILVWMPEEVPSPVREVPTTREREPTPRRRQEDPSRLNTATRSPLEKASIQLAEAERMQWRMNLVVRRLSPRRSRISAPWPYDPISTYWQCFRQLELRDTFLASPLIPSTFSSSTCIRRKHTTHRQPIETRRLKTP
jgi:hypothetical protein